MSGAIRVEIGDGIATVVLDKPEARNALDIAMLDRLPVALEALRDDDDVACVVLTGAGEQAFCAGGDVRGLGSDPEAEARSGDAVERLAARIERWAQASVVLHEMPKPTLGVVNGTAAGAGMALALACDLRIGCEHSRFVTAFSRIALSGDFGGSHLLTRLVGPARARELYLLSDPVPAARALDLGLLNWQVPAGELHARAREIAVRLAALPGVTRAAIKANLNAALEEDLRSIVRREAQAMARTATHPEAAVAAARFFASRGSGRGS